MNKKLMSSKELTKRLKKVGSNPKKIIELSIEKWIRLGYVKNWEKLQKLSTFYMYQTTCSLCMTRDFESCEEHPLFPKGCPLGSCDEESQWRRASLAVANGNRKEFMIARYNIIRRLKRAKKSLKI